MQERINDMLKVTNMTFGDLAQLLGISKQTLTKKVLGKMDFTYPEMSKMMEVFPIEDPQVFFFG